MNKDIFKFALVLMIVASIVTAGVALVYGVSKPEIDRKSKEARESAVALAFNLSPKDFKAQYALKPIGDSEQEECWLVYEKGDESKVFGYAALGVAMGYAENVKLIVAVDAQKERLVGTMIFQMNETPGLGSKALDKVAGKTWLEDIFGIRFGEERTYEPLEEYPFLWQYHGKSADDLHIVKSGGSGGVVALTGATITSAAVSSAVKNGWKRIRKAAGDNVSTTGASE